MAIELGGQTRAAMDRITAGCSTKSDKIRALGSAGYARGDIARYLHIRYQHVRNVLIDAGQQEKAAASDVNKLPRQERAQVGSDGRVMIPAAYRKMLGIEDGGELLMLLDDNEVRLVGRQAAIRRAQELVAQYIPKDVSLVDELLAERRREAAREERGE